MPCTVVLSYHEVMSDDAHATAVQEIFISESPQKDLSGTPWSEGAYDNALATACRHQSKLDIVEA